MPVNDDIGMRFLRWLFGDRESEEWRPTTVNRLTLDGVEAVATSEYVDVGGRDFHFVTTVEVVGGTKLAPGVSTRLVADPNPNYDLLLDDASDALGLVLYGPEYDAVSFAGPQTRAALGQWIRDTDGELLDGKLILRRRGSFDSFPRDLLARTAALVQSLEGRAVEHLHENAVCDAAALVQVRAALLLLEHHPHHELTAAALAALEGHPDPLPAGLAASDPIRLIRELLSKSEPRRVLACRALGQVGDLEAVEPLNELTSALWQNEESMAAQKAIQAIQAREGGAHGGALSLHGASHAVGALSMDGVGAEHGTLSMDAVRDEEGGPSPVSESQDPDD